jgi:hypothetical protein
MLRKILATAILAGLALDANAALTTGDIAFTSFNADEDGWAIVNFVDIAANTTIYFNDNEWNGSAIGSGGAFNNNQTSYESAFAWITGSSVIEAGSVVRFTIIDNTNPTPDVIQASSGLLTVASAPTNLGLANSNETIYAYIGSDASTPSTFLSAITNSDFGTSGALNNTGLTSGINALRLRTSGSPDFGQYTGIRSGEVNFDAYKALVANVSNWTVDTNDGNYTTTVPNTTPFTVSAVPVPAAVWLFGSALAGFGVINRRKNQV